MRLSQETQRFLEIQSQWTAGAPTWKLSVEEVRVLARDLLVGLRGPLAAVAEIHDVDANGVPGRLFIPTEALPGALVWLHGGGWMLGGLDSHEHIGRELANRSHRRVLLVDYRLAPENPYPAATDDAWGAALWAHTTFGAAVVGGDSAGGTLTASVALRARDCGIELARQILVYPTLEYRSDSDAHREFESRYRDFGREGFGTNAREGVRRAWDLYVPDAAARSLPDVAPLKAQSLEGVAPATILVAEHDILTPEGEEYARRLTAAGVDTEIVCYHDQIHGFLDHPALLSDARDALHRIAHATNRSLDSRSRAGSLAGE